MADEETQQDAAAEDTGYAKRIPSVPKPDKNKFDQKVADLQEEITRLQAKMETVQGRMNELKGKSGKVSGPVGEAKAQMRVLRQKKDTATGICTDETQKAGWMEGCSWYVEIYSKGARIVTELYQFLAL